MKLRDLCELIVDCEHKTAPTQATGYPSIRTPNIGRGYFILDGVNRVSEETYRLWTRRAVPQSGDLIMAREAPVGNVAMIPQLLQPCLGQRTLLIRPDCSKVDPSFLNYFLNGPQVQGIIQAKTNGATVAHLNMEDVRTMELPELPPLPTQRRTGEILSAYDYLIENNTQRMKILEQIAQMLYREWFVNFRFPGHKKSKFRIEKGRRIPHGWQFKNLFDMSEVTYGFPFKSKLFTEKRAGIPVVRIRDILSSATDTFTTESADEKYLLRNGDLLVGMDGDFHIGKWSGGRAYQNQRVVRFRPKEDLSPYFLFLAIQEPIHHFDSTIVGTTVAHLSDRDLRSVEVLIPDDELLRVTASILNPCFDLEINLALKNSNLRTTRDLLLPRLVSGEVNVDALEVETAAQIS